MKMYVYIWLVLLGILTVRCSSDDIGNPEEDSPEYDSYWYYSYEAAQLVNAETLGMEALEDFSPYTVAHLGDTLFVANIGKEGNSLLVFNTKEGRLLDVVKSWQFDNEEVAHSCVRTTGSDLCHLHWKWTMEWSGISGTSACGERWPYLCTRQERKGQYL